MAYSWGLDEDRRLPIAVDNDHAIWSAFGNEAWPAFYFVDAKGRIRHHQFGEGKYDQAELIIQQLLAEAGNADVPQGLVPVDGRAAEAAPDWADMKSPETYVGFERADNFASVGGARSNKSRVYAAPAQLDRNLDRFRMFQPHRLCALTLRSCQYNCGN
jgi:hypothetical protein